MKKILKELAIYVVLLTIMAYSMHGHTLSDRIIRVVDDPLLIVHALWWAFAGYVLLIIPRLIIRLIRSRLTKQ